MINMRSVWIVTLAATMTCAALVAGAAGADVDQLAQRWTKAYNNHDRAAVGALYTESAHLYLHGRPSVKNRKAIEEYWAGDFKEGNPLTLLEVTNSVAGIDMVLVHGNYKVIDRKDGRQLGYGRFAHIWVKNDKGEWLLDRDLWNQPYEEVANGN